LLVTRFEGNGSTLRAGLNVTNCPTRPKLLPAAVRASAWLCAWTDNVNAPLAWPNHAAITAIGT
jgi:hypothetical protein